MPKAFSSYRTKYVPRKINGHGIQHKFTHKQVVTKGENQGEETNRTAVELNTLGENSHPTNFSQV